MANFHTHLTAGTTTGVIGATVLFSIGEIQLAHFLPLMLLATIGGILPDVDSDHSDAIKIVFDLIAIVLSVIITLIFTPMLGILLGLGLLAFVFILCRYGIIIPFRHLTHHRGIFHTIPMGLLFALSVCLVSFRFLGEDPILAWIYAAALFAGFFTHLLFDELYSVNLSGVRLKKSFGTAMKLYSRNNLKGSILLYAILAAAIYSAPSISAAWSTAKLNYKDNLFLPAWSCHFS
ncbi:MAG: metal-dependent hydrolase [Francisellaceae bacterium]